MTEFDRLKAEKDAAMIEIEFRVIWLPKRRPCHRKERASIPFHSRSAAEELARQIRESLGDKLEYLYVEWREAGTWQRVTE